MTAKKTTPDSTKRPPIVTVMGHVDHGKTTLLDYIRKTSVAAKEKGGITQAIGACEIEAKTKEGKKKITFIDTPGHAAFAKMRARGANVTDLVILVVAADDGIMPQTKESISHIKQANVPLIVAVSKTDLPSANIERVKKQLAEENILVEGYGGNVVIIPVSAKTGEGIDNLLEMVILISEMEEIKGDPNGPLSAPVIESRLDPRKGPVATVIIKNGTAKTGDSVTVEGIKGKIRAMLNDKGENLKEAPPSTPVEILGLNAVPATGSIVEREDQRKNLEMIKEEEREIVLNEEAKPPEVKKLKVILKADVAGSIEAILANFPPEIEVITSSTGEVNESDVLLAKSTGAVVLGFNTKVPPQVAKLGEEEKVLIKVFNIIYELLEELTDTVKEEEREEEIKGEALIIAEFPYEKKRVAGCRITKGIIARGDQIRIERQDKIIGTGKVKSLRRFKEEVPKTEVGDEYGVFMEPEIDFAIGDVLISTRPRA